MEWYGRIQSTRFLPMPEGRGSRASFWWAPDLCERCGREIAAHALGEARLPAHFTDLDGQSVCLSCAAPGVTPG